jgi:hypothetical protein
MRISVAVLAILSASLLFSGCETNPAPVGSASATVTTRTSHPADKTVQS